MGKPRFAWLPGLTMGTHSYGVTPALFQAPSLGSVKGGREWSPAGPWSVPRVVVWCLGLLMFRCR